jgi:hypothetical protein
MFISKLFSVIVTLICLFIIIGFFNTKRPFPTQLISLLEQEKVTYFLASNSGMDYCTQITIKGENFFNSACESDIENTQAKKLHQLIFKSNFGEIKTKFENGKIVFGEFTTQINLFFKASYYYYISDTGFCQNEMFNCQNMVKITQNWYFSGDKLSKD